MAAILLSITIMSFVIADGNGIAVIDDLGNQVVQSS